MPFGQKRFKKAERERILRTLKSLSVAPTKNKVENCEQLKLRATEIFGFNGWSHCIRQQTIDYIDCDSSGKYEVAVNVIVKVTLKDGTYHEEPGYGISKGLKCKGTSLAKARKSAVDEGLLNALSTFGSGLQIRKDADYRSYTQQSIPAAFGVKRKLDSSCSSSQNYPVFKDKPVTQSEPVLKQTTSGFSSTNLPCSTSDEDLFAFTPPPTNIETINIDMSPPEVLTLSSSDVVLNQATVERKLKQVDLEIRCRENHRAKLMDALEYIRRTSFVGSTQGPGTVKMEQPS